MLRFNGPEAPSEKFRRSGIDVEGKDIRRSPSSSVISNFKALESRHGWLATFTDSGTTLNLALGTSEQVAIVSTGSTYQLTLATSVWSGSASDANVTSIRTEQPLTVTELPPASARSRPRSTSAIPPARAATRSLSTTARRVVMRITSSSRSPIRRRAWPFPVRLRSLGSSSITATASGGIVINSWPLASLARWWRHRSRGLDREQRRALTANGNLLPQQMAELSRLQATCMRVDGFRHGRHRQQRFRRLLTLEAADLTAKPGRATTASARSRSMPGRRSLRRIRRPMPSRCAART